MSARETRESYAYLNAGRVSYLEKQMDAVSRSFAVEEFRRSFDAVREEA